MGFAFSTQDDGHILIVTLDDQYDLVNDLIHLSIETVAHLDEGPDGTIVIINARAVQIKDLNSLLAGTQKMSRPEVRASMTHPKVLKTFSVINNKLINAAVKGLNATTFGYVETTIFETVEAAIAQAQAELEAYRDR